MSIGYLIALTLWATCTAAALAPPRRPRTAGHVAYFLGLVVNEVPQLAALLLLTATVQTLEPADLASAGGQTAVALTGVVCAGLVVIAVRGLGARDAVAHGLREAGLGAAGLTRGALRVLLAPIPVRPRNVERIAGIRYGRHRRNRLDVYRRRGPDAGGPVLVYLHGGGYSSGGKHREARALLHRLAGRGWTCISATYRLRPQAGFEEHLTDAKRVLAWAHEHAASFGADPRTLVMSGSSAGAHLTALCALTQDDPALQPGFEDGTTRVDGAVCLYGYYGRYYGRGGDETPPSTPFALDASDAPPFLLAHGDRDSWTRVEDARALAAKLKRQSRRPVVYLELPGGQHGFDLLQSWRFEAVLGAVDTFVEIVAPHGVSHPPVRRGLLGDPTAAENRP
jgi:acetyl esterase/lipase